MLAISLRELVAGRDGVVLEQLVLRHTVPRTPKDQLEAVGLGELASSPVVALPETLADAATYVSVRLRTRGEEREDWTLTWDTIPSADPPAPLRRLSESVGGVPGLNEKLTLLWQAHTKAENMLNSRYSLTGWASKLLRKRRERMSDATLTPTGTLWVVEDMPLLAALSLSIDPYERKGMLVSGVATTESDGLVDVADLEGRLWTDLAKLVSRHERR